MRISAFIYHNKWPSSNKFKLPFLLEVQTPFYKLVEIISRLDSKEMFKIPLSFSLMFKSIWSSVSVVVHKLTSFITICRKWNVQTQREHMQMNLTAVTNEQICASKSTKKNTHLTICCLSRNWRMTPPHHAWETFHV